MMTQLHIEPGDRCTENYLKFTEVHKKIQSYPEIRTVVNRHLSIGGVKVGTKWRKYKQTCFDVISYMKT